MYSLLEITLNWYEIEYPYNGYFLNKNGEYLNVIILSKPTLLRNEVGFIYDNNENISLTKKLNHDVDNICTKSDALIAKLNHNVDNICIKSDALIAKLNHNVDNICIGHMSQFYIKSLNC